MAAKKTATTKVRSEKTGKAVSASGKSASNTHAKSSKAKVQAAKPSSTIKHGAVKKQLVKQPVVAKSPAKAPVKAADKKSAVATKVVANKVVVKSIAPVAKPAAPAKAAHKMPVASPAAQVKPVALSAKPAPAAVAPKAVPVQLAARTLAPAATQIRAVAAAMAKSPAQRISAPVTPKDIAAKAAEAARHNLAGAKKPVSQRHGFKTNEYVVYPAHGVGRIVGIEEQEIAGMSLELFVITFDKDKMTLRVPTGKLQSVGMRKLAEEPIVRKAMETLKGRARVKRTMWSRRAQEYEAKINSGDLVQIAEVVRDLYRSEQQPEQSYSERQLYEAALDRMAREIAAVDRLDERGAMQRITEVLSKSARGRRIAEGTEEAGDGADVKAA